MLLFTVIRVKQMLLPKNSREADPGERPQASAGWAAGGTRVRETSHPCAWEVREASWHIQASISLLQSGPALGTAGILHGCTEHRAPPKECGPQLPVTGGSGPFILGSPVSSCDSRF